MALGATKWQTIRKVVLPPAVPGIITGTILSIGRAAGETAPILFTAVVFSTRFLPSSIFEPVMALPYHLYILSTSVPGAQANAYATALVLLILVILFYGGAILIRNYYHKKMKW
jgi:phosphate transport system permease protein